MSNQNSSSINCLVLADSHASLIPPIVATSSYNLIIKSISGLKWKHDDDPVRSVYALLSLSDIKSSLIQASAVLFLIGTNSVRMIPAYEVICQVRQVIFLVQQKYPHLNQANKISISLTFPCVKRSNRFPTSSLMRNINLYNEKLKVLSSEMNFNILDLQITRNHLGRDRMHIDSHLTYLILNPIISHFNQLILTPSTTSTTSNSTSDEPKASQSSFRSRESIQNRNKQRHDKRKLERRQHVIKRKLYHQWNISQIKQYLESLHVRHAYIPHFYNNILRLQFNNQEDQDFADSKLGIDIFNEYHYKTFINNQPS
jgi:hypothetical protein